MLITILTWGPEGVVKAEVDVDDIVKQAGQTTVVGVTIEDDNREITYDGETRSVSLTVDGHEVREFEDPRELSPQEL